MNGKLLVTLVFAVLLAGVLAPAAMALPSAWYSFNGTRYDIPDNAWTQDPNGHWIVNWRNQTSEFLIDGNAEVIGDPQILYGISVQNFSFAPATFEFNFYNTWVTPFTGPTSVYGAVGGHVTDGTGNGVDLTLVNPYLQMSDLNGTDMGVDAYNHDFHATSTFPGEVHDIGTDIQGPRNGPEDAWTQLHIVNAFTLSDEDDVAVLTGSAILFARPVPEPATALLLVPGLLGLVAWRSRKRS